MKKLQICFSLLVTLFVCASAVDDAPAANSAPPAYGTITGFVRDPVGRPLAGAVITLLRDGAGVVVKQTTSTVDGTFSVRAVPGRYVLQAALAGFDGAQFSAINVGASDELVYRFNLQRMGEGRTVVEQRRDRDDAKFRVRAANMRRSVFQAGADEETVALVNEAADRAEADDTTATDEQVLTSGIASESETKRSVAQPLHGVVQTYMASGTDALPQFGLNFALAQRLSNRFGLILSGQTGSSGTPERFDVQARSRFDSGHTLRTRIGAARLTNQPSGAARSLNELSQISLQAVDEWIARDGVVVVLGFDYAHFLGDNGKRAISPRLGVHLDANAKTRFRLAYAPGERRNAPGKFGRVEFEDGDVILEDAFEATQAVATPDGELLIERSRRFEFGVERVLDNRSRVEATAFFDTTDDRGVGLMQLPASGFRGESGAELLRVAEQEGSARGVRVVYARRLTSRTSVSAGYSFGRGQELAPEAAMNLDEVAPQSIFRNAYFHTGAAQVDTDFETGTQVQAVVRFSSQATVFAVDPFAGQLAVYDPSLSVLIAQELPNFGLPVRLKAMVDARNLLDLGAISDDTDASVLASAMRRSVRGGIAVRF